MKEMINERILQFAVAQECMVDVAIRIDQWEQSQEILEKNAFDCMNIADTILNLSKEGTELVNQLYDCFHLGMKHIDTPEARQVAEILSNVHQLFHHVLEKAQTANDIAHNLEQEISSQRELGEGMQESVNLINESVDAAVACAEFIMAEL